MIKEVIKEDKELPEGVSIYTRDELVALLAHLDDETEWETINDFWQAWSPRLNHRIHRLIVTALAGMPKEISDDQEV